MSTTNGLVKLVSGSTTITATYLGLTTSVTTSIATTGPMGADVAMVPIFVEDPANYASDAAFKVMIEAAAGGTGSGSARYTSAAGSGNGSLITWQSTGGPTGGPTLSSKFVGANLPAQTNKPILIAPISGTVHRLWIGRQIQYPSAFSTTGDADTSQWGSQYNNGVPVTGAFTITPAIASTGSQTVTISSAPNLIATTCGLVIDAGGANQESIGAGSYTVNSPTSITATFTKTHLAGVSCNVTFSGQSSGYKHGPFGFANSGGRDGSEVNNTGLVFTGGSSNGFSANGGTYAPLSNATWTDELYLVEYFVGTDGNIWVKLRCWTKPTASPTSSYVRMASAYAGPDYVGTTLQYYSRVSWTPLNYNQSRLTDEYKNNGVAVFADADNANNTDPWGVLALDNAQTAVPPQSPTLVSQTSSTATVRVLLSSNGNTSVYAKKLRPVIDGVDTPAQDVTLKPEQGESWAEWYAPFAGADHSNAARVIGDITITGLATGAHTITFKAINGNGVVNNTTTTALSVTI